MCRNTGGNPAWAVRVGAGLLALHAWGAPQALAQSATSSAGDGAPSEAARRQALSPFRMILQNANAPRRAPTPAPAAPPAAPKRATSPPEEPAAAAIASPVPPPVVPAPAPAPAPQVQQVTAVQPSAAAAKPPEPPAPPPPIELIPLQQDPPLLAAALRREQPQGKVMVGFAVKPDGTTGDVHVVSSTDRRLNSASVNAVSGWRFKPIRQEQPVEVELVFGDD